MGVSKKIYMEMIEAENTTAENEEYYHTTIAWNTDWNELEIFLNHDEKWEREKEENKNLPF